MKNKKQGFTLIELIIYVGISSLILLAAINIAMNVRVGYANNSLKQELYANARVAINQIRYQITNADALKESSSVFDSDDGILALQNEATGDVSIESYLSGTNKKLKMKIGTGEYNDLTNNRVNVSRFKITKLTRSAEPDNLKIELVLDQNDQSVSLETAISLRK